MVLTCSITTICDQKLRSNITNRRTQAQLRVHCPCLGSFESGMESRSEGIHQRPFRLLLQVQFELGGVYHPIVCRETTACLGVNGCGVEVYHPIVCRETTAFTTSAIYSGGVYHPIVCRETTAVAECMVSMVSVYHPIVCRETTARTRVNSKPSQVYHPIVCRETTACWCLGVAE